MPIVLKHKQGLGLGQRLGLELYVWDLVYSKHCDWAKCRTLALTNIMTQTAKLRNLQLELALILKLWLGLGLELKEVQEPKLRAGTHGSWRYGLKMNRQDIFLEVFESSPCGIL